MTFTTRFAPSPTGPLHLGHAYSAMLAHDMAQAAGGSFLLRIEDIDQTRAKAEWEDQIYDDLAWLGLRWATPVMRQSDRLQSYRKTLQSLWARGFLYPCTCTRRDVAEAASAPQEGGPPLTGPDGIIYPGTCRTQPRPGSDPLPEDRTLRLNMAEAIRHSGPGPFSFEETGSGPEGDTGPRTFAADTMVAEIGDIVLARRDMGTSYHLSVVLDDAAQGITHVVRGQDLFEATKIHVTLQRLLDLPTPIYHHHNLIRDDAGKRLAKRDDARSIAAFRADGASRHDIRRMVGL